MKTMRRAAIIGAVSLCFWAGVVPDAAACRCFGGPVCIAASLAEVVFIGRASGYGSVVQFEVERAFKGVGRGQITLANGPGNCALPFTKGERYFVYANRDPATGALMTGMCTRTLPLSDPHTRADIAYFTRRQHRDARQSLLTGVVTDRTIDLGAPIAVPRRPLGGIRITATPQDGGPRRTATTRGDGSYEMSGITAGRWSLAASLPARFVPHEPVTVLMPEAHPCREADIGARMDGRISGHLLDERGLPLRNVDVQLADAAEARGVKLPLRTINGVTDEHGYFEFQYVGPGRYVVGVNLQASLRAGTLNRRRFYGGSVDPNTATVVALEAGERRQLPPFQLPALPADRVITIVVQAPTDDIARGTWLFLTGAILEPLAHTRAPLSLRLPFGASYLIEAVPPSGYRITHEGRVRIAPNDTDKTIEIRVEKP
jgi:hypothetical protein